MSILLSMSAFALAASISPGPVNIVAFSVIVAAQHLAKLVSTFRL